MGKIILGIFSAVLVFGFSIFGVRAQMMNANNFAADDHTAREEAEGKVVWEKLQTKQADCEDLSDEDFGALGEYFMGTMMGDSHAAMNAMMVQAHGEKGEEQIHIVMGKRLSGCDPSAAFPAGGMGWMPMMNMMWGGWSSPSGFNSTNNMMNFGYGFGALGWVFMLLWWAVWWALIIAGILALIRWLPRLGKGRQTGENASALEVLKQRYAKGEIDRKEFEEKLRDIKKP